MQQILFLTQLERKPIVKKTSFGWVHFLIRLLMVWVSSDSESAGTWDREKMLLGVGLRKVEEGAELSRAQSHKKRKWRSQGKIPRWL